VRTRDHPIDPAYATFVHHSQKPDEYAEAPLDPHFRHHLIEDEGEDSDNEDEDEDSKVDSVDFRESGLAS